jgi:hypothetical protein
VWEQWFSANGKAVSKRAMVVWGVGTPDDCLAHPLYTPAGTSKPP